MSTSIKISRADDLKIIKSYRKTLPTKQVHKNKKAYSRQTKHKNLDY